MSTITSPRSPRPSTTASPQTTPDSSRRQSTDTLGTGVGHPQPPSHSQQKQKKDRRAALRDYYGIKNAPKDDNAPSTTGSNVSAGTTRDDDDDDGSSLGISVLDKDDFDAQDYVGNLLAHENLQVVLKAERRLLDDIRSLDGERKALVYDNYSKLIVATETIKKMRANMDPLGTTTATLSPAISHIAATAETVMAALRERQRKEQGSGSRNGSSRANASGPEDEQHLRNDADARTHQQQQQQQQQHLVRRVLDSPRRIRKMMRDGQRDRAKAEWADVARLLDRWEGVDGVQDVRREGERALTLGDA